MTFTYLSFAQQYSLSGRVINLKNNRGIIGAKIKLSPFDRETETDINGNYSFDSLSSGTYVINCTFFSYVDYADTIVIKEMIKNEKNIFMTSVLGETTNIDIIDSLNEYKMGIYLKAYANNYHPKINELIKISIHFTSPGDFEKGKYNLGFSQMDGMKIVKCENYYQDNLLKGQKVDMTFYVKFLKRKIYNVDIRFFKRIGKSLFIYVDGAFRESREIEYLKKDLDSLKQAIGYYKTKHTEIPLDLLYFGSHYKYSQSQTIIPHNKYERSIVSELKKKNIDLFNTLKQEIDSLTQEARIYNKILKREEYLPPADSESYKWQREISDSLLYK